ncbi:receptor-like protein 12 [Ziziphus jujuba]|uniref:Receptor-like protein 12 n=1 Tax=Ziziphus jujuba TaxID=326968 RepID=A0ABM3ZRY7_ZIZJJ|nr:receptor-like protein 12 [Ziziphus jujuba]
MVLDQMKDVRKSAITQDVKRINSSYTIISSSSRQHPSSLFHPLPIPLASLTNPPFYCNSKENSAPFTILEIGRQAVIVVYGMGSHAIWKQVMLLALTNYSLHGPLRSNSSLFRLLHLRKLNLVNNNFSSCSIPSEFGQLSSNLTSLTLRNAKFARKVPNSIGNLKSLDELAIFSVVSFHLHLATLQKSRNFTSEEMNLLITFSMEASKYHSHMEDIYFRNNSLTGSIPSHTFGNLTFLHILDLSSNSLNGAIPFSLLTLPSFRELRMDDNQFIGLEDLEVLDASNNHLDGTIPQCLENLDGSLRVLNLQRNSFLGNIPQICRDRSTLMTLDLSHNQLYGNIPKSFVKCKNLDILNLGHNQLSDTFPFWLQDLQRLPVLVLSSNKFRGAIWCPRDFFGFMTLKTFDLSHNGFTGNLPLEYFRNWTSMSSKVSKMGFELDALYNEKGTYNDSVKKICKGQEMELVKTLTDFISIDLFNNKLDGEIPSTLWHLRSLVMLNLSSNSFSGLIPSSLGNLKELESLDLSNNKLFGKIPQQLTALTFLAYLNLSHNQLVGQIPQGGQVSTFQDSSFEGNMRLCGLPLSRKCESPHLAASDGVNNNEKSDSIFSFGWKAVVVGYGCGLLIGMVARHVVTSRRPDLISKVFWGNQFATFKTSSYDGNLGLRGYPVAAKCGSYVALKSPPPASQESWFHFAFVWVTFLPGCFSGLVVGIVTGNNVVLEEAILVYGDFAPVGREKDIYKEEDVRV